MANAEAWGGTMAEPPTIVYRLHALLRMAERRVSESEVEETIRADDTIEMYIDDKPYPSRLLLSPDPVRPLHVVTAGREEVRAYSVMTAH